VGKDVLKEEETQENPTLFVRINSSGTTLTGDDLIYSIYKATFPQSKDLVENVDMDFITPTQTISLVSRLAWFELNDNKYPRKMNVRDFQRNIKTEEFKNKLLELIEIGTNNNDSEIYKLFKHAINILNCKNNSLFKGEIPPVLIKQFIKNSQDLFLFFVCWLRKYNRLQGEITESEQLQIVAKLFSFSWFSFGNVPKLWNEINNRCFLNLNETLNQYFWWNGVDGIHFLLPPDLLKKYYCSEIVRNLFLEEKSENHQHMGIMESRCWGRNKGLLCSNKITRV
jgi:hypothetical protein